MHEAVERGSEEAETILGWMYNVYNSGQFGM
jgi:hypothetical protein